jgi:Uma2 family endonuclease
MVSQPKPPGRPATYEDLLALPEHVVGEIIAGELHVSPRPASSHARAQLKIGSALDDPFDGGRGGPGGWWILPEPELHLGDDIVAPDLAGWTRTRMPTFPKAPFVSLVPDWICEILSPSTGHHDQVRKLPLYAGHDVRFAWLVDPALRTVIAYRNVDRHWSVVGSWGQNTKVRIPPFDAIEIDLSAWWVPEDPAAP